MSDEVEVWLVDAGLFAVFGAVDGSWRGSMCVGQVCYPLFPQVAARLCPESRVVLDPEEDGAGEEESRVVLQVGEEGPLHLVVEGVLGLVPLAVHEDHRLGRGGTVLGPRLERGTGEVLLLQVLEPPDQLACSAAELLVRQTQEARSPESLSEARVGQPHGDEGQRSHREADD